MKILLQTDAMRTALSDMFNKFADTIPNVVMSLVIFLIGYIVAKFVAKMIRKVLLKLGVDKIGEKLNEIDIVQKANLDIKISGLVSKIMYYLIMLFSAVGATSVLGIPEISDLVKNILEFIPNLLVALIVLILGTLLADALRKAVHTALKSLGVSSAGMISSVLFYFLFINIVVSALSQAKINTEFLSQNISIIIAGVVGAFAIGYGLASKDAMGNMIASFYSGSRFNIGDRITVDGVSGIITDVDKSSITIKTEKSKVVFPLNKVVNQKIEIHD